MVEFNGAGVVAVALPTSVVEFVPVPSSPDMVVWALHGPAGEIPYADVEALVDLEFDDRIGQMETLQQSAQTSRNQALSYRNTASDHATAAASSASTASTKAGDAATSASQALAYRNTASTHASTATTKATEASNSATTATTKANAAAAYAADAEQWANSFGLTVGSTNTAAPGSSASVNVTGSGPEYALTFNIPQGAKGDTGPRGERGDDGEVSQAMLDAAVATLVDNAPEALNTLSELATSLGNDPNFATTVSTEIGKRALIDGAPAAYNTLGKLVTALQNHELGGSTDASLLTGALTDQVDVTDAMVDLTLQFGDEVHHEVMPLSEFLEGIYGIYASLSYSVEYYMGLLDSKSDVGHTHPVSEVDGLQSALDGKAATGHKHPVTDLTATGTRSSSTYLRGDGTWATPPNNTYTVPTQAEAEAGTATAARAFSAQRVRQAADAAINAKIQKVSSLPASPDPNVLYVVV